MTNAAVNSVREQTSAIASGSTEAFARFYEQWFDLAYAEARRVSGRDEQFCLDVVQEAMMRVIRSIKPMESEADVRRWLLVVVQTCCLDCLRAETRRRRREASRTASQSSTESDATDLAEQLQWLRRQLSTLDAEQARLLSLRFRLGWTLQRIGAVLGLKPGAVDGRITRSLAALRSQSQENPDDQQS